MLNLEAADAARKAGSAGKPVLHAEVRVVAEEGGRDVAPGEVGELWVRGPAVTPGYWNNPEATHTAFAAGGWLRTGDAVRVDEEGFFSSWTAGRTCSSRAGRTSTRPRWRTFSTATRPWPRRR